MGSERLKISAKMSDGVTTRKQQIPAPMPSLGSCNAAGELHSFAACHEDLLFFDIAFLP